MPKAKPKKPHKTKHVVTKWRGQPVKPKRPKRADPHRVAGRAPADPELATLAPAELSQVAIRATVAEINLWRIAARLTGEELSLPAGMTAGPWARRALNADAARVLGRTMPQPEPVSEPEKFSAAPNLGDLLGAL